MGTPVPEAVAVVGVPQSTRAVRAVCPDDPRHLDGILAWTRLHISNGAVEGMNNKVKVVSHRAFGFRTVAHYMAAIWHGCGGLPLEPVT